MNKRLHLIIFYSKTPELKECVLNLTTTMDECLDDNEKETGTIVESIVEALLSFMCHDEGDRIACKTFV